MARGSSKVWQLMPTLLWVGLLACLWPNPTSADAIESILGLSKSNDDWLVSTRRTLHAIPERGSEEFKTSATIKKKLDELGIKYKSLFGTGIVATVGSGKAPFVALRADIDALPIQEPEGLPFRSTHPHWMHACGHDGHMTMLLGGAKLLQHKHTSTEGGLQGTVKLVFQPNEEFGAGGDHMVREGALDDVQAVFGIHVMPIVPSGKLATRPGTIMAGALSFHVNITGRGGHAAMPHLNVDPVVAAASLISSLQTLVSREVSPLGSAVLSVTLLRAGDAYNVIPDVVQFGGTIRALDHDIMMHLKSRVETMSASVAAAYGCNASVDWRLGEQPYYPPTVNNKEIYEFTRDVASRLLGKDNVLETEPIMPAEDFAFYCRAVPCTFAFLGIRNETLGSVHGLHNPQFLLDESVLHKGAAMHAAFALEYLATHQPSSETVGAARGVDAAGVAAEVAAKDEL